MSTVTNNAYEYIVGKQSKENLVFILKVTTLMMIMMIMVMMMNDDTVISDQSWCTTKWSWLSMGKIKKISLNSTDEHNNFLTSKNLGK